MENKHHRNDLIYKTSSKKRDKIYDFQKVKTKLSFGREIYNNDLSNDNADIFKKSAKPKEVKKEKRALTLKNPIILLNGRQKVLNAFESGIFPKRKQGKGLASILNKQLKILNCKEMLEKLPIALVQVKAGNKSENLASKIR